LGYSGASPTKPMEHGELLEKLEHAPPASDLFEDDHENDQIRSVDF
jgi:hypothetical protein